MTLSSPTTAQPASHGGSLFGVPVGDFGWFATILIGAAAGFMAFFASTFCAIVFILIYNSATHRALDFALSYRRVGLPVGLVVMAIAFCTLGSLWLRRILRRI